MQNFDDKRVQNSYGSMLLFKKPTETKYHILVPLETVPTVFGTPDTFDYDLLTSKTKGVVQGKESLDSTDVQFLYHRDNVKRLESLQDMALDFLTIYKDFTGRKFTGTIKVRPNENSAGISYGTFTITPISATPTSILDCRDLVEETIEFVSTIPDDIVIDTSYELNIETYPASGVTLAAKSNSTAFTTSVSGNKVTISKGSASGKAFGLITITGTAEGYASWETTIAVSRLA